MKNLFLLLLLLSTTCYAEFAPIGGGGGSGSALTNGHIFVGDASNAAADVAMSGQATIANTGVVTLSNAAVIAKILTGYVSGAGTVAATDTILEAINKLNGNTAAKIGGSSGGVDKALIISDGVGGITIQAETGITFDTTNHNMSFTNPVNSLSKSRIGWGTASIGANDSGTTDLSSKATIFWGYLTDGTLSTTQTATEIRKWDTGSNTHWMGFSVPNTTIQTLFASDNLNIVTNHAAGAITAATITTAGKVTLPTNVDSATAADLVSLTGFDLSAGHRSLAIGTEETVASDAALIATNSWQIRINGVTYKVLLATP